MSLKVWNSTTNTAEDALDLPDGSYAANVGFWVQQSVNPDYTLRRRRRSQMVDLRLNASVKLGFT